MLGDPAEKNAIVPTAITPTSIAITLVFRFVPFLARQLRIQSSCNRRFHMLALGTAQVAASRSNFSGKSLRRRLRILAD